MNLDINQVAAALFEKIRSRFDDVSVGDEKAKATQDPEKARFLNFDYIDRQGNNFGNVTISLVDENSLKVYFGKNLSADLDEQQKAEWYDFLRDLRMFAKRNLLTFDTRDISRSNLHTKDIKQTSKSDDSYTPDEVSVEESFRRIKPGLKVLHKGRWIGTTTGKYSNDKVEFTPDPKELPTDAGRLMFVPFDKISLVEGRLFGSTKTSYDRISPTTRIVIKHDGHIDDSKHGSRTRHIKAVYVEDNEGQRLKCPFTNLAGCRALGRHVSSGGQILDEFGQHIGELVDEMTKIKRFVQGSRNKTYEDTEANDIVQSAKNRYGQIHQLLHKLKGPRGYKFYKESWKPSKTLQDDINLEELRARFVQKNFDERLEDGMPYAYRAHKKAQAEQQLAEFESWTNKVTEGTWSMPDNDIAMEKLQDLMANPLEAGIDGENATGALYDIVGDDDLFDKIYDASRGSPDSDVRPIVFDWLKSNMPSAYEKVKANIESGGENETPAPPPPGQEENPDEQETEEPTEESYAPLAEVRRLAGL